MVTLYTATHLLPDSQGVCPGLALAEEGGRIITLAPLAQLQVRYPQARLVDFGAALILPAFMNAHTHLELSLYPQWATAAGVESKSTSFVDWILRLIRVKRSIKPQALGDAVAAGINLCLQSGTAAVGDILSRYEVRGLYREAPLRGRVYLETLGQDQTVIRAARERLDTVLRNEEDFPLELGVSPHSPYTIRPQYMSELYQRCRDERIPCATHIAESPEEIDFLHMGNGDIVERFYTEINWHQYAPPARRMRPLDFINERGGLFADHLLIHGVQLSAAEIEKLAASAATLVLCPRSNAWLQVGTAPVAALKKAGVKLALGTDSLASNSSLSLWDELAFASQVYGETFTPAELFELATQGGARALGLQGQLGALEPGLRCSFQVVEPPDMAADKMLESLVRNGRQKPVKALILDGHCVL